MVETPALLNLVFDDAGTFASALTQAQVSCIQTSTGPIQLNLTVCKSQRLELHFTSMPVGSCVAIGKGADLTQSFHVPLGTTPLISMMGRQMEDKLFAKYERGGEHAICARSGAKLAYIVPTHEFLQEMSSVHLGRNANADDVKFDFVSADPASMARLRSFLGDVSALIATAPEAISKIEVFRHIEQELMGNLLAAQFCRQEQGANIGRAPVGRGQIFRKIDELLRLKVSEPIYVTDLCLAAGVSQPTLYRIFCDVIGMSPKRYLQLRRLHLARQKLISDANPEMSVLSVAFDCGFWQHGRFGAAYRQLFGETPSETLKRSRKVIGVKPAAAQKPRTLLT